MSYIVWVNNGTDGWGRSDDYETLEECYAHVVDYSAHTFVITSGPIKVKFVEETA